MTASSDQQHAYSNGTVHPHPPQHNGTTATSCSTSHIIPPATAHQPNYQHYPADVGIVSMDIYFPQTYVSQAELESHMNVSAGKYTVGLGQEEMSFVTDREDIYSITLSAVSQFMSKFHVSYHDIGRLEVGTETISDHSKAVKSVIMNLFKSHTTNDETGEYHSDIEGIDCMNACYGGTNALFNSLDWVESSSWNGKYALAIATDIAEYADGAARPTGGVACVVMLVGANASLVIERGVRSTHMQHVYDFFKPHLHSPYPVVDGKFSGICYLQALDICYQRFQQKYQQIYKREYSVVDTADHVVFHAPYNKLVQKSYARLLYLDAKQGPDRTEYGSDVQHFLSLNRDASYTDAALEKAFVNISKESYKKKVYDSTLLPRRIGNMYTASLYAGLLSLIATKAEVLAGKNILMFSYGSGLAASMFSIRVKDTQTSRQQLSALAQITDIQNRLSQRTKQSPTTLYEWLKRRESLHQLSVAWELTGSPSVPNDFSEGTYYLVSRDEHGRRTYKIAGEGSYVMQDIPLPH